VLKVDGVRKTYRSGGSPLSVLRDISFRMDEGQVLAVVGPSGSGKTTLLGLLAGLDLPTEGTVRVDGTDLASLDENGRARLRREKVGFVFQSFQLIPTLTAVENVRVPLELRGDPDAEGEAERLLGRVGLAERIDHYPVQLSGGEQQRVALARAFVNRPRLLLADEPTGNLDADTGGRVVDLMMEMNREQGTTIVLVTHDTALASRAERTITLRDGRIVEGAAA